MFFHLKLALPYTHKNFQDKFKGHIFKNLKVWKLQKEGTPAICDNMHRIWGHYSEWNKSGIEKYSIISLYAESIKAKLKETEYTSGYQELEDGENEEMFIKEHKLPVIGWMGTIVNTVSHP